MPNGSLSPIAILRAAIKNVPALKYAFGVLGLVAVLSIIASFRVDYRVALFGSFFLMVLMICLLIFAKMSTWSGNAFKIPGLVFLWFALLLGMTGSCLLMSSVFFSKPVDLQHLLPTRTDNSINPVIEEEQSSVPREEQVGIVTPVPIDEEINKRVVSVTSSRGMFVLGLKNPNQIVAMDDNGTILDRALDMSGSPTILLPHDNKVFIATEYPFQVVSVSDSLNSIENTWEMPVGRELLNQFGKEEAFDGPPPHEIRSLAIANKQLWVLAADNNAAIIYTIDLESGAFAIPSFFDMEIAFDGRGWDLHSVGDEVYAVEVNSVPSGVHKLTREGITRYGGHDYAVVDSTTTLWPGIKGGVGLIDSNNHVLEVKFQGASIMPLHKEGTLPNQENDTWVTSRGAWSDGMLLLAVGQTRTSDNWPLWISVYALAGSGKVTTLTTIPAVKLKSMAVAGKTILVCGEDFNAKNTSYIVKFS